MTDFGSLNATQSSMASAVSPGGMLLLIVCIVGIVAIMLLITSLERYTKLLNAIGKWASTLKYTCAGGGLVAIGYGLYVAGNFISSVGKGIDPIWIVEAIGAYIILTLLGYGISKVYGKFKDMHNTYKKNRGI